MKKAVVNKLKRVGGACLFLLLFVSSVEAAELANNWTSTRALGMGNAYTAVVSDADALFYNPAGLANISGINWTIFDFHGGFDGTDSVNTAQSLTNASTDLPGTMKKLYGQKIWAGAGAKSAVTLPGFGIAAYGNADVGLQASSAPNPVISPHILVDYGLVTGFGLNIIPGLMKIGIVGKRVNRTGTTTTLGSAELASLDTNSLEQEFRRRGTGYGVDVGALIKTPGPISPSASLVYRDVGNTSFTFEEGAGAPPPIEGELIAGAALEVSLPLIRITPAFDFRYLNRSDVQLGKKISAGVEVSLPVLDIRAGLNQGYYTAGVGVNLSLLRIDVATWGVELGEYPGQREDRRYMANLTFEIGFDAFGLFSGSGSSHSDGSSSSTDSTTSAPTSRPRLKQRR